ncbi:MAG: hypothetical protein AB8E82_18295 [Aureispira sp.]
MEKEILETYNASINTLQQLAKFNTKNLSKNLFRTTKFAEFLFEDDTISLRQLLDDYLFDPNKQKSEKLSFIRRLTKKLDSHLNSKFIDIPDCIDTKSRIHYLEEFRHSIHVIVLDYVIEAKKQTPTRVAFKKAIFVDKLSSNELMFLVKKHFENLPKLYQERFNEGAYHYLKREISSRIFFPIIDLKLDLALTPEHELERRIYRKSIQRQIEDDLLEICIRLIERKTTKKLEDLLNDDITDLLRTKGYLVTDQTRSGKSLVGNHAGELDIMIRDKNQLPLTIIEAFRESSAGEKNSNISNHLNKTIHNYDPAKLSMKYILVYCEAKNFVEFCQNYHWYLRLLKKNNNDQFLFKDISSLRMPYGDDVASLRTINSYHKVNGLDSRIKHILIDYCK